MTEDERDYEALRRALVLGLDHDRRGIHALRRMVERWHRKTLATQDEMIHEYDKTTRKEHQDHETKKWAIETVDRWEHENACKAAIAAIEGAAIALRHAGVWEHSGIIDGLEKAANLLRQERPRAKNTSPFAERGPEGSGDREHE